MEGAYFSTHHDERTMYQSTLSSRETNRIRLLELPVFKSKTIARTMRLLIIDAQMEGLSVPSLPRPQPWRGQWDAFI